MNAEEERCEKTVGIVGSFVDCERQIAAIINRNKEEKELLLSDIKDYVTLTNPHLFGWWSEVGGTLRERGIGEVELAIDDDQPQLFPESDLEFKKYPAKTFYRVTGSLKISMNSTEKVTLSAKVIFGGWFGKFIWEDGNDDYFFSQPHLVKDEERFGSCDVFDRMSWLGSRSILVGMNYREMRHPVDIINERLIAKIRTTLERRVYGEK